MNDFAVGMATAIVGSVVGAAVSVWVKHMLERKTSNSGQRKVWGALALGIAIGGIAGYVFG